MNTFQELQSREIEAASPKEYVLRKRGLFYRPNDQGYTSSIKDAGRYTYEEAKARTYPHDEPVTMHLVSEFGSEPDWKCIADELASALERLDALYRSEQDPDAPVARPEWLRHPWQRYHRAIADEANAERTDRSAGSVT